MYISIIIPTLDRKAKLKRCIDSILAQTHKDFSIFAVEDINHKGVFYQDIKAMKMFKADAYLFLADDTELSPSCLAEAVKAMQDLYPDLDGVVSLQQDDGNGQPGDFPMIGHKFTERFPDRQVYYPEYKVFCADLELHTYAESLGKFHQAKKALFRHWHPGLYPDQMDDTHMYSRNGLTVKDQDRYDHRKVNGFLWGRDFTLGQDYKDVGK